MLPLKSAERAKIDEIVEQVKQEYQKTVHQIRWELDRDWSGDWSLYFRVVMKDHATRGKRLSKTTTMVQDTLRQRIDPLELDLFCYFRFSERIGVGRVARASLEVIQSHGLS